MELNEFSRSSLAQAINLHGRKLTSLRRSLEKRVLLDASVAADVSQHNGDSGPGSAGFNTDDGDTAVTIETADKKKQNENSEPSAINSDQDSDTPRQELVVIDLQLDDAQSLVDDLLQQADSVTHHEDSTQITIGERSITLLTLDGDDSLQTVTSLLQKISTASGTAFDAVHIISHGGAGGIDVGGEELSLTSLTASDADSHRAQLQSWSTGLSENADILLYGCSTGYSQTGENFIDQLAQLTNADVAASDDATGSALRGGDWELEQQKGEVETDIVFSKLLQGSWEALMVANPTATVDAPSEDFINETTEVNFVFENNSSDTGYGPFMDVVVGPGIEVQSVDGLLGASFETYTVENGQWVDSNGNPLEYHPYDLNQTGAIPLPPVGPEGSTWYAVELPFGSFTEDQPAYEFTVSILLDEAAGAEVGVPIPVYARPGFMYGNDPLNNPDIDPPITGSEIETSITPTVMKVDKEARDGDGDNDSIGDDGETVTGPSEPVTWAVTVDIANMSTIENLVVTEQVPNNFYYMPGTVVVSDSAGNVLQEGVDYTVTEPPEGANNDAELVVEFLNPVEGTLADNDIVITYTGYVPDVDANGDPIVINDGANDAVTNTASVTGTYQEQEISDDDTDTITATATAVQKDVVLVNDTGAEGFTPGDGLEYTLTVEVSDYMQLEDLVLSDILGDGLQIDEGSITIELFYNGTTYGPSSTDNATVSEDSGSGETTINIDISQELIDLGISDGSLNGDLFADSIVDGTTTIVVTYEATIREQYLATGQAVNSLDVIGNQATIDANAASANGEAVDNSSSEQITIEGADSDKSVYAVNGSTDPNDLDEIRVGDAVTFALTLELATLDTLGMSITDYLPQPVFEAIAPIFVDTGNGATTPGVNQWGFGPGTDFGNWPDGYLDGDNVTTSADTANNAITWTLDPVEQLNSAGGTVQLLFTVEVQDVPFTDGLFLTNMASVSIDSTNSTTVLDPDGTLVQVLSPSIDVTKGVISTDDPNGQLDPTPPGPVAFDPAGSPDNGSAPWSGDITSQNLDTTPIDSDLSNVDAGDTVRFAIVVENSGGSDAFNIAISDTLPDGFEIPSGGLNLQVFTGNGTPVSYSGDLFSGGITLDDPSADEGALNEGRDPDTGPTTDGSNVIVITYDLVATDDVQPNQQIENTAQLEAYGALDGGNDYTEGNSNINWQDDALVSIRENTVEKTLVGTSINSDTNANNEAVIGEVITYSVTLTIAEGETPSASLVDTLDTGLQFIGVTSVDFSGDIDSTVDLNTLDGTVSGQKVTFDLGDLTNSNRDNATAETITITYQVLVQNVADNQSGDKLNNSAQFFWDDTADGVDNPTGHGKASASNVTVIEPDLQVDKSLSDSLGRIDANDLVEYTIVVSHTGFSDTDAFDATFSDTLPPELTNVALESAILTVDGVDTDLTGIFQVTGNTVETIPGATFDLPQGATLTIVVDAQVISTVVAGTEVSNTATVDWQSIDGDDPNERTGADGPGGLNDYETSGTTNFTVDPVEAGKVVVSSSIDDDYNGNEEAVIGELVTYFASFLVPEGSAPMAEILDTLPEGVEFVSLDEIYIGEDIDPSSVVFTPPAAGATGEISFGTADLINIGGNNGLNEADLVGLVYTVRVLNVDSNQSGVELTNEAEFRWDLNGNGTNTDPDDGQVTESTTITVIEPQLQIDKSVNVTEADNGDPVEYTITVTNPDDGSSTTAYDISFNDPLPDGLVNATFIAILQTDAETTDISGYFEIVGNELVLNPQAELDLVPGSTVTITVSGSLTNALAGSTVDNTASVDWTSLDGEDDNERTGADGEGGALNDYANSDNALLSVPDPLIEKNLVSTSQNDSLNDDTEATIGEIVTFETVLTLPEATLIGEILDNYGPGFEFVDLVSVTANNPDAIDIDFNQITVINDPGSNTVAFDFGTLVNTDTDNSTTETITFTYRLRVTNVVDNQQGTTLTNDATLNYDTDADTPGFEGQISDDATVDLVEPEVVVDKELLSPTPLTLGGTAQYQITVQLDPSSGADAYNVHIADALPPYLSGVNDVQIDVTGGSPEVIDSSTDNLLLLDISVIDSTTVITITIDAQVTSDPAAVGQSTTNNTTVDWTSIDGDDPAERTGADGEGGDLDDYETSDEITAEIEAFDLFINKDDGGIDEANPAVPGQEVTYTFDYGNTGTVDATNVVITETLPDFVTFDPADNPGWTLNGDTLTFDVGTVAAGATGSTTLVVTIVDPVPAGVEQTTNTVSIDTDDGADPTPENNTDTDVTPIIATPDYVIDKIEEFNDPANPGDTVSWTIEVSNEGNQDGTGVVVTDTLPDTSLLHDFVASDGGVIDLAAGTVTWEIGDLAAGDSITLTLSAVVNDSVPETIPTQTNSVTVEDDGENGEDPTPENNTDEEDFDIEYIDLAIVKDDGGITAEPGDTVVYTLNYANNGTADATGVVITETLPEYASFDAAASTAGWVDNGDGTFSFDVGDLAAGETGTVEFAVTIVDPLPAGVEETNNFTTIEDDDNHGPDQDPDDNDNDDNTPIDGRPDYVITKEENFDDPAHPGDPIEWTITVSNEGNQDGTGVVVTDTLPDTSLFHDFVASDGGVIDLEAGTVTWEIGDMAVGDSFTFTISAVINDSVPETIPTQTNSVTVDDDGNNGEDPTPDNNSDDKDFDITYVDYVVDKIENFDDPTHPGDPISWTIEVSNEGTQDGTGVVVTDTLPDTALFTDFTASNGGVIDLEAGTVTWNIGDLAAGESVSLTLSAVVAESVPADIAPQINTVVVDDDGENGKDRVPENNQDSEEFFVEFVDLYIDKDDKGVEPRPTESIVYTLEYGNRGNATSTGVVITETLPPNTSFDATNSTPGWVQNGDTFTFDVGSLAPGEQGSITFAVIVDYPLDVEIQQTSNTATITDDDNNGPDQNPEDNIDTDETKINNDVLVDNITLSQLHQDYIYPPREWERQAPELHGRLISKETEDIAANLQGGRNGGNYDPAFGPVDGAYYPNDWSRVFGNDLSIDTSDRGDGAKSSPLEMDDDTGRYRANSLFGEFERPAASPELPAGAPGFAPGVEPLPAPFQSTPSGNEPLNLEVERSQLQLQLDDITRELHESRVSPLLLALAELSQKEVEGQEEVHNRKVAANTK
ncbi:isopeptide-forming domain-containing fimbrial protein [Microbulbifer sp.]|uniref:isopeptide-forming domain-containing fimbrial protein n=1 Tax=Microbulbifer sp. TaxID=1908541 RepID=UPI0025876890|nr:isopeptide-forming domain-containing fimbrial protein [Microbulbifer sp.]